MKKANLYFGLTLFFGFLLTGYYMSEYFKPEHIDNHIMRMQIRANHIYILFIALLNVISFKCDLKMSYKISKYLNTLFRTLLIFSGIIAVVAFFQEHTGDLDIRNWTLSAVVLSAASVGIFIINELIHLVFEKKNP